MKIAREALHEKAYNLPVKFAFWRKSHDICSAPSIAVSL